MDLQSVVGLLLGLSAILVGQYLEGGDVLTLLNLPAALIVIGGTVGAVMLATPFTIFKRAIKQMFWVFFPPDIQIKLGMTKVINWSQIARREGLLGLEALVAQENDMFSRKALQLLVDGTEPEAIRTILELDVITKENADIRGARVYEGMGGYSPTFGILGAVLGLIHVMGNLSDPNKLGAGIAIAFVATVYGVALANLLYLPVSHKIREVIRMEAHYREMIMEGVVSIAEGENPHNIELKLEGFLQGQN